jgi:thiol-disulfide isomerase/thioredoxin
VPAMLQIIKTHGWIIIFAGLFCLSGGCKRSEQANQNVKMVDEKFGESIEFTDLEGKQVSLTDFEGRVVFLNIWATWCGPCLKEMPSIERASKNFNDDEVVFLLASDEDNIKISKFKEAKSFSFNYLHLVTSQEQLNVYALPATFIFDAKGDLVFEEKGSREWDSEKSLEILKKIIK